MIEKQILELSMTSLSRPKISVTSPNGEREPSGYTDNQTVSFQDYREHLFSDTVSAPPSPSSGGSWSPSPSPSMPSTFSANIPGLQSLSIGAHAIHPDILSPGLLSPQDAFFRGTPSSPYALQESQLYFPIDDVYSPQHSFCDDMYLPPADLPGYSGFPESSITIQESQGPSDAYLTVSQSEGQPFMGFPSPSLSQMELASMSPFMAVPSPDLSAQFEADDNSDTAPRSFLPDSMDGDPLSAKLDSDFKRNPEAMRKQFMSHYRKFFDENKVLKIFSKRAKNKVATLNGLRASSARRKNPARFRCEIDGCNADFTRKHNLESTFYLIWPYLGAGQPHEAVPDMTLVPDHMKSHYGVTDLSCDHCGKGFTTIPVKKRHQESCAHNPSRRTGASNRRTPANLKMEFI
jgi:hypothetical protein